MAIRNPTAFTKYVDATTFVSGKSILAAGVDDLINDQQYCLDAEQMVINAPSFYRYPTTSASFVDVRSWHLDSIDKCNTPAVAADKFPHKFWVYAMVADGATQGEVKVTTGTAGDSATVTITSTSWAWVESGSFDGSTNGNEESFVLAVRRTVGAGGARIVYIGGLLVMASKT